MGIELAVLQPRMDATIRIRDPVAHLGQTLPEGKEGLTLRGRGIADHHGKIFCAYNSYFYVNLTELPTEVFRGRNFSFRLDPLMPQCQILKGDQLRLGSAIVQIVRLTRPGPGSSAGARIGAAPRSTRAPTGPRLKCRYVDCRRCKASRRREVVRATSSQVAAIEDYTEPHEILRASMDCLVEMFRQVPTNHPGLVLGIPDAIAIRQRPGLNPRWLGSDVPIERGLSRRKAKVAALERGPLSPEQFDTGVAFRFADVKKKIVGIGAGILEGIWDPVGVPQADHLLLLQYRAGKEPGRDDACLVHHTAAQISRFLATVNATRLRQERELELRAGEKGKRLFHEMLGIFAEVRESVAEIRSLVSENASVSDAKLAAATEELDELARKATKGVYHYPTYDYLYEWADLRASCQEIVSLFSPRAEALDKLTGFRTVDLSDTDARLSAVPCDSYAVERAVLALLQNSMKSVGKTGHTGKRVHVLLDVTERNNLPYARIRVVDDGTGMASEVLSAVFEVRFLTDSGRHGLGTKATADAVRWHYGFIEVASKPRKGTVVGILVPAPARGRRLDLKKAGHWLKPWIANARLNPLVSREGLDELLRRDRALREWYSSRKGRKR